MPIYTPDIQYPDYGAQMLKVAQLKNAMIEQQLAPIKLNNEFVNMRINNLKAKEIENEFKQRQGREAALKQFYNAPQPAQPAQTAAPLAEGAAPSYTGNALAQNLYGQSVETQPAQAAKPGGFDTQGYIANRYGAGDIAGAQAMEAQSATIAKEKLGFYALLLKEALTNGDDPTYQGYLSAMKKDPHTATFVQNIPNSKVTGKNELTAQITVDANGKGPDGQPVMNPISNTPLTPGTYDVKRIGSGPGAVIKSAVPAQPKNVNERDSISIELFGHREKSDNQQEAKAINARIQTDKEKATMIRIPGYTAAKNLPAGYTFNRRTGEYEWKGQGQAPNEKLGISLDEYSSFYPADQKSLQNIVKGKDTINAFEKGVSQSLDLVDRLSTGFERGQFPGINKLSQIISYHGGDPNIKAFKNAVTTAMTEYMKVTTAGTGISVSELTQGAQERAKTLLETSDNIETFKSSLAVMRQEMQIKKSSFDKQESEIKGRISGNMPAPENAPASTSKLLTPKKGSIDEGYIFNGGDPAKPENWRKK